MFSTTEWRIIVLMLVNIAAVLADDAGLVPTMNIEWVRGADGMIVGTASDSSGALLNLTGSTILLSVRTADSAAFPIFTRTGALTDAVNGVFTVTLTALDTDNLAAGAYRYDVWLTDNAGRHQIVKGSIFTLLESDTHVGEGATPVPPIYNGAVDTVNDGGVSLASVDASLLGDGAFMWVRRSAAGDLAPGAYFHIEVGQSYAVDHRTVETALGLAGGQWVLGSPGGGGAGVSMLFADGVTTGTTQLASMDASIRAEGQEVYVATLKTVFQLQASTATAVPLVNIAASGKSGYQWVRRLGRHAIWGTQLTWSVDGQNSSGLASDENSGIDDTHPLLSYLELSRRVRGTVLGPGLSIVVRNMSDMGTSDGADFDVDGVGTPSASPATPFPVNGYLTIVGVPTVVYSGTISSAANASVGTNADNHFTDAGSPPAFSTTARIWKRTNGQVAYAWPQKDLTGGVFRTSKLVGGLASRTWANGDSYQILSLPAIHNLTFTRTSNALRTLVSLVYENTTDATVGVNGDVHWYAVQFADSTSPVLGSSSFVNCRDFLRRSINQSQVAPIIVQSGGLISNGNGSFLPAGVAFFMGGATTYLSFQGVTLALDYGTSITEIAAMFYDCVDCIQLPKPMNYIAALTIGGMGNTGKIFNIQGTHSIVTYAATPAASMTTDALPFQVKAATAALGTPIVDATYLSMIQAN